MLIDEESAIPAVDFTEKVLAEIESIPTVFGRLIYMAAMWDPTATCYRFDPRIGISSPGEMNMAFSHTHQEVFLQWLSLSLNRQRRELMRFADSDGPGAYQYIWSWWVDGFFDHLAPATADRHETQLFRSDLLLVIKSLIGDTEG